jgi:plastocyanin
MATNNLDDPPYFNPNSGRIVRQTGPDSLEPVVTDADYPVMLGFDDAGDLYLTYPAFGTATMEGEGALLQLDLSEAPISLAEVGDLTPSCQGGPGSSSGATPEASPVSSADTQAVDIVDFSFSPGSLEIPAGTTVTWTNGDVAPHTVTAIEGAFDSGRLDAGGTFSFIFDEPGTFTYMCEFHPAMQGTITVT